MSPRESGVFACPPRPSYPERMSDTGFLDPDSTSPEQSVPLDFRIRRRDRYSIEVKFRHLLDPNRESYPRRRKTRIRLVFFLPYSFNIRPETLDATEFYDDVKLYVRFNTPTIPLEELLDPVSRDSPLARLGRMLGDPTTVDPDRLGYEARLLGAVLKTVLRDTVVRLITDRDVITQAEIDEFCDTVARLDSGFAAFRSALDDERLSGRARTNLSLIDEHLSLTLENYLVRLLTHPEVRSANASTDPLREAIAVQQEYRRSRAYRSVVEVREDSARREEYIYRYKMLKHYASSVLFFEIHRGNQAKRVEHLLYAFAAGLAMAIATGISFIGQIRFGTLSTTLFLVLVGAYMIKDRIKDAFRSAFQQTLGRLFYDTRTVFKDQTTRRAMGVVKERTMFVRPSRLDTDLLEARARGGFESALAEARPERTLEYTKLLHLNERRLHRTHRRITGLADINIIDLKDLLRYLVRQREEVPVVSEAGVELEQTRRIYHLNLLISADTGEGDRWHKVRLIVDAGGIRRIERPDADTAE